MRTMKLAALAVACVCLGVATARAQDQTEPSPPLWAEPTPAVDQTQAVPVWRFLEGRPEGHVLVADGTPPTPHGFAFVPGSNYWVGIGCTPLGPEVRAHVDVPEGQGLLVHGVAPESPAAVAGVERFDILLSYGDAPVASRADLVAAVDARGTEETTLTLIRAGEQMTVAVTPTEREEGTVAMTELIPATPIPAEGLPAEGTMQFRLIHPPAITRTSGMLLPEGVQIQITKNGEEPAEIRVTRGEETWNVTEDDLSPLPEDLRPAIQRMLPPATAGVPWHALELQTGDRPDESGRVIVMAAPRVQATPLVPAQPRAAQLDDQVRLQLDQLQLQIDQLRRTLEAAGQ